MKTTKNNSTLHLADLNQSMIDSWFTNIIDQIKTDLLLISEKVAPKEKIELYTALMK